MKAIDLTGQRFGRLVVACRAKEKTKHGSYRWVCDCDCGAVEVFASGNLRSGHTKSCGCLRRPHGYFGTKIYNMWSGMKKRCLKPSHASFKNYGGRGIKVCDEWLGFIAFKDWAIANGYKENLSIDRIENDGNYEPNNCRFVTVTVNNQNRRNVRLSPKKVILIRHLLEHSKLLQKDIGRIFKVSENNISQIKSGETWSTIIKADWNRK